MEQAVRQRLRFELAGLESRDLEQQAVGGARLLLQQELKSGPHIRTALQELLSGLDTCSRNAVKLRLQLAEYCILKCTSKAQLPTLLPFLTKQGNKVLDINRSDAACISALAALMSSCLAKLLHEPAHGSCAPTHQRSGGDVDTADALCEALLFPVISSTYRDPEQARVAAGSEVLLALLEVLKTYAQQLELAVEAVRMCLELMVQLLGMGTLAQRVPGVLLPVCTCLDVLGASAGKDCVKRVLLLCLKGAVAKDVWQVRRDSVQTLAVLASCVLGLAAAETHAAAAAAELEHQLLHPTPALKVLVMRKPQAMQVLEDARYDKIAAVRAAAAAALVKFSTLPDPPQAAAPAAPAAPDTPSAVGGRPGSSSKFSSKHSKAKQRRRPSTGTKPWQTPAAGSDSARQRRFARPRVPPGAVLDYGVQVFAPPSPPRRSTPTPQSPQQMHDQGDAAREAGADQTPTRRHLDFEATASKATSASPSGLQPSAEAASQTCEACGPAHQTYTVQSPLSGVYAHPFGMAGGMPGSPHSATGTGQLYSGDALQMMDQNQRQHGLNMLAAGAGGMGGGRLDVNHHVHGRVELGIVSGSPMASPLRPDAAGAAGFAPGVTEAMLAAAAAAAAACASPMNSMAGAAPAGTGGNIGGDAQQQAWWLLHPHTQQQQLWEHRGVPQQQQQYGLGAESCNVADLAAATAAPEQSPAQHAAAEPSFAVMPEEYISHTSDAAATAGTAAAEVAACVHDGQAAVATADAAAAAGDIIAGELPEITAVGLPPAIGSDCDLTVIAPAAETLPMRQQQQGLANDGGIVSIESGSTDGQHARRARQRWQLPNPEHLEAAAVEGTAAAEAAGTPTASEADGTSSNAASPLLYSASPNRSSLKSVDRSCSRQSSRSARDPGSSLEVLRNVGARVQGLLESLSRQTSGGGRSSSAGGVAAVGRSEDGVQEVSFGGAMPAASAVVCSRMACDEQAGAAAGSAACLADLLSSPEAGLQQQQSLQQLQQEHEVVSSPHALRESYQLLASLQLISEDSRALLDKGAVAAAEHVAVRVPADSCSDTVAGSDESGQPSLQQQEQLVVQQHSLQEAAAQKLLSPPTSTQQVAAAGAHPGGVAGPKETVSRHQLQHSCDVEVPSVPEPNMSVQFNNLYQPKADPASTAASPAQAAAGPPADALQPAQQSVAVAAGSSAGLAQVERALLKLQTLRSTLQSIGSSAASSRQHSLRASRTVSATGEIAVCSPEASSSQVPGGSSSGALAQPASAEAVLVGTAADLHAVPAEQSSAAVSNRDWIKQLSQRIQQAGTGDTSSAAQLEAAMASLQAQQGDTAAAEAASNVGEAAALAAAGNVPSSSSDSSSAELSNLVCETAAPGATTAVLLGQCLEPAGNTGMSRCSSRVSQHAGMPLLKLLESGCPSEASDESACSPAVAAAAAAAASAAAALAAAAACQETAADAEGSTVAVDVDAGGSAPPTGDFPSHPWVARLAATGPGSPNWSTATATSVSTAEGTSQPQGNANASRTAAGVQQQPDWDSTFSGAEHGECPAGPASPKATAHLIRQQHPAHQGYNAKAAATSASAAAEMIMGGAEAAVTVQPAGRLQQMLDASDDTALLLSLALKLDMLAKKFRGRDIDAATTSRLLAMPGTSVSPSASLHMRPDGVASGACNAASSPVLWTSVTHNDLFVPSPVKAAADPGSAYTEQHHHHHHHQQQQHMTAGPLLSSGWAGDAITELAVMPDSAAMAVSSAAPHARAVDLQRVQAAALQQVLGIDLLELHSGSFEVAAKIHQACARLQQQLADYQQQPLAGAALAGARQQTRSCSGMRALHQASVCGVSGGSFDSSGGCHSLTWQRCQVNERQLQPLRVLLMHQYQQAVHEQCRQQCLQQQHVPYGWEAAAQAAAEQQVQEFAEQQLPLVMDLLVKPVDAEVDSAFHALPELEF